MKTNFITQIKEYIHKFIFLLYSKKRQRYLIEKNACMFIGLQNLAKKSSDDGDLVGSMMISGDSYKYLFKFCMYCRFKNIDEVKRLLMYK